MVARKDEATGRVVAALEELEPRQNALVIFASDNGGTASARPSGLIFWRGRRGQRTWLAMRAGELKLAARVDGAGREEYLFDLERDPGKQAKLLAERKSDAARLRAVSSPG